MSMVATDLKGLFSISIKARHDSFTDQFHRIFMVKILLACTIVMGISWYNDKVNCILPGNMASSADFERFVQSTCWIQGMYVYKELRKRIDDAAYYGIPKDLDNDGMINKRFFCSTKDKFHKRHNEVCEEMEKTFYIQYQYMPFFICTLALLYYIPYMMHKKINHDLINLKEEVKKDDGDRDVDKIVKAFFPERRSDRKNSPTKLTVRQLMNIIVKCTYVVINFVAFFGTDSLLQGEFYSYGKKWLDWSKESNNIAFDYMGKRDFPKPGNELLPPFGYCELYSSAKDVKTSFVDKQKLVCEISQHILYQYSFILLWFVFIIGMVVSILGLLILIFKIISNVFGIRKLLANNKTRPIIEKLTHREHEYLEFIHKKKLSVYGEVLDKLRERIGISKHRGIEDVPMHLMKGKWNEMHR